MRRADFVHRAAIEMLRNCGDDWTTEGRRNFAADVAAMADAVQEREPFDADPKNGTEDYVLPPPYVRSEFGKIAFEIDMRKIDALPPLLEAVEEAIAAIGGMRLASVYAAILEMKVDRVGDVLDVPKAFERLIAARHRLMGARGVFK